VRTSLNVAPQEEAEDEAPHAAAALPIAAASKFPGIESAKKKFGLHLSKTTSFLVIQMV